MFKLKHGRYGPKVSRRTNIYLNPYFAEMSLTLMLPRVLTLNGTQPPGPQHWLSFCSGVSLISICSGVTVILFRACLGLNPSVLRQLSGLSSFFFIFDVYFAHCRHGVQTGDAALSGGDRHSDPGGGLGTGDALVIASSWSLDKLLDNLLICLISS